MTQQDVTLNDAVGPEPTAEGPDRPVLLIVLGALMVLTGIAAVAFPFASSLAVEIMVGSLFLAAGVFTTFHAFAEKTWKAFLWELLIGVLYVVSGVIFLANPLAGVLALTVMLGVVFVTEGILRIVMGFQIRPVGRWGLLIASGALSILLGVLVLAGLANGASVTIIGTLMGINFVFAGGAMVALGLGKPQPGAENTEA